tara:strand:+ start:49 stop:1635 length:1587 start_codon:yes stop_codon:yes gene_type:complete
MTFSYKQNSLGGFFSNRKNSSTDWSWTEEYDSDEEKAKKKEEANTYKEVEPQSDDDPLTSHLANKVEAGWHNLGVKHYNIRGLLSEVASFASGVSKDLESASYFDSHPLDFNQKGKAIVSQLLKSKDYWLNKSVTGAQIIGDKFNIDKRTSGLVGGAAFETLTDIGIGKLAAGANKFTQGPPPGMQLATVDNVVQPGLMKGYTQDVLSGKPLTINIETPFTRMRPGMTTREAIKAIGDTSNYKKLKKKYKYLTPEQIVDDPNLIRRLKTKEAELVALNNKVEGLKSNKDLLLEKYPDSKIRPKNISNEIKQLDKNISKYSKELTDVAGGNPLLEGVGNRQIYGNKTIRTYLKKNFPEFDDNLNRWHHKHGSADIGKSHLTDLTQDPWIKVNLYAHMKKNKIFSSGTVNNLVLIKEFPHNEWHKYAKSMKLEPEYFISSMQRWVNSDLTFFQYIEDISKEVIAGNADINELFTIVEAYGKAQKKINAKLFTPEFAGKNFSDVTGIVEKLSETSIKPTLIKKQAIKSVSE